MNVRDDIISIHYDNNYDILVKRVCRRVGNNYALAEEIVQEAYTRALRYFSCFDPDLKPFEAWFNTILNNATRDIQKEERESGMPRDEEDFVEPPESKTLFRAVSKHIDEMSASDDKEIMHMYFNMSMTPKEISEVVESTTPKTIRNKVAYFKKLLSDLMK